MEMTTVWEVTISCTIMRLTFLHGKQPAQILILHGPLPGILVSNSRRVRRRGLHTSLDRLKRLLKSKVQGAGMGLSLVVEDITGEAGRVVVGG